MADRNQAAHRKQVRIMDNMFANARVDDIVGPTAKKYLKTTPKRLHALELRMLEDQIGKLGEDGFDPQNPTHKEFFDLINKVNRFES